MRTDKEIETEIQKLQELSKLPDRWNAAAREVLAEQANALSERSTHAKVELALHEDETTEEYDESDNDLYREVDRAVSWMNREKGFEAPSKYANG